ncbi:MAG: hypothetical protein ACK4PR_10710, partial [Gammaproteobacteria bacterium]
NEQDNIQSKQQAGLIRMDKVNAVQVTAVNTAEGGSIEITRATSAMINALLLSQNREETGRIVETYMEKLNVKASTDFTERLFTIVNSKDSKETKEALLRQLLVQPSKQELSHQQQSTDNPINNTSDSINKKPSAGEMKEYEEKTIDNKPVAHTASDSDTLQVDDLGIHLHDIQAGRDVVAVIQHHEHEQPLTSEPKALVDIRSRVLGLASAIGFFTPAKLTVHKGAIANNVQAVAIGDLDKTLSEQTKKALLENILDKTMGEKDPLVKMYQMQIDMENKFLAMPNITSEKQIFHYEKLEKHMNGLLSYCQQRDKMSQPNSLSHGMSK